MIRRGNYIDTLASSFSTAPPMSKGRGISSASFLDLKSELSKKESEFKKAKDSGKGKVEPIHGGVKRADKARCGSHHNATEVLMLAHRNLANGPRRTKGLQSAPLEISNSKKSVDRPSNPLERHWSGRVRYTRNSKRDCMGG